jgi:hypothetical protein
MGYAWTVDERTGKQRRVRVEDVTERTPVAIMEATERPAPDMPPDAIDPLDTSDGLARVMFIYEPLPDGTERLHTWRWNGALDPSVAHNLAVKGVNETRGMELAAVRAAQARVREEHEKGADG